MLLLWPQGKGGWLETEVSDVADDSIHHTEKKRSPNKNSGHWSLVKLPCYPVNTSECQDSGWCPLIPQREGTRALHLGAHRLYLVHLVWAWFLCFTKVPKLFGSRNLSDGRQVSHGPRGRGVVSGYFKGITFIVHFISSIITSAALQMIRH